MLETTDLVQDTIIAALGRLDGVEAQHPGALQAYLRICVKNRIRDLIRQQRRRPQQVEFPEQLAATGSSPQTEAEWSENMARYEMALKRLSAADRAAIVARLQWQYTYSELAGLLGKSSEAAARMAVTRAMRRLAAELQGQFSTQANGGQGRGSAKTNTVGVPGLPSIQNDEGDPDPTATYCRPSIS